MNLKLRHPPTPENAAKHAQIALDAAWNVQRIKLDYSPQSLENADHVVRGFHLRETKTDQINMLVFCFGCYLGEVLVRNNGGVWKTHEQPTAENDTMVVALPNGVISNPIATAFKVLEKGDSESMALDYHVAITPKA